MNGRIVNLLPREQHRAYQHLPTESPSPVRQGLRRLVRNAQHQHGQPDIGARGTTNTATPPAARCLLLPEPEREAIMLWTLAVLLIVLWGLGLVTSYTMGGFIHLLLVFALVAVLVRVIQGRRIT